MMLKKNKLAWLAMAGILWACHQQETATSKENMVAKKEDTVSTMTNKSQSRISTLERDLINKGLINLQQLDSTIIVDLRYSTTNNFVGTDVYGELEKAYMQEEPAQKLVQANAYLKETHPNYTLYIFDAVRPRRVQQILWDTLDYPEAQKSRYVANPQEGSIHNYGAAVDLTIAGPNGKPLDMGTEFDYFGVLAYPVREEELLATGKLTHRQVDNRRLLRNVMTRAGFSPITSEWWHFNAMSRAEADKQYGIVE